MAEGGGGNINLGPALQLILVAAGAADWTTLIDPWGILGLQGRPRDQATEQVILRLRQARNPAARLWSVELTRGLLQFNLVISTGGSGRTILEAWSSQFVANLVAQGVPLHTAREIAVHAVSREAQAGAPLEAQLTHPLAPGLTFNGPQGVVDTFLKGITYWQKLGKVGADLLTHAQNFTLNHASTLDLTHILIGQPNPENPQLPVLPEDTNQCQPGYTYDPKSRLCWPTPVTPPPLCPPGQHWDPLLLQCVPDQLPPPPPDDDGDELTDCCNKSAAILQQIADAIKALSGAGDTECCTNVVAAIAGLNTQLEAIATTLAGFTGGPAPIVNVALDLTTLVDAVNKIDADLKSSGSAPVDLSETNAELKAIADKLGASSVDVAGITEQLKQWNLINDIPHDLITQLFNDDLIPKSYSGLLQGTPSTHVKLTADTVTPHSVLARIWKDFSISLKRLRDVYNTDKDPGIDKYWNDPPPSIDDLSGIAKDTVAATLKGTFDVAGAVFKPVIDAMLKVHGSKLAQFKNVKPGGEETAATALLGEAVGAGVGAHFAAVGAEMIYPTKNLGLPQMAALLAELAGFREIMAGIIGPEVEQAIAIPHRYKINSDARAVLPAMMEASILYARRKIGEPQFRELVGFNGISRDYEDATLAAAFRPVQPRALATALQDAPFPADHLRLVLEDNAYAPDDVQFMLDLFEYQSTRNIRNSYVQEAMTAYGQGVIDEAELNSAFDDVGWSEQARSFATKRALLLRRINLARDAEATVVPEIKAGLLSHIEGVTQLEAAGIQDWKAELQATKADSSALINARRKLLSAEAKAEADRKRNLTRAAVAEFQRGVLNEAGLAAALIAIPLDPFEAGSIVAVQNAVRTGKLKFIYGKLLTPEAAATLRIRVEAIGDQFRKQLVTDAVAQAELAGNGVDQRDIDALLAKWAALRGKPTTTGQFRPV